MVASITASTPTGTSESHVWSLHRQLMGLDLGLRKGILEPGGKPIDSGLEHIL